MAKPLSCDYVDPFQVPGTCIAQAEYLLSAPGAGPDTRVCGEAEHLRQSIEAKLDASHGDYIRVYRYR